MTDSSVSRVLGNGRADNAVLGVGTWVMGGPFWSGEGCAYPTGTPLGYGRVDDAESARVIHCALDHDVTLFDTADAYGTGHAEEVLGAALKGRRASAFIATKFGNTYDSGRKILTGTDVSPDYIRAACMRSLKRLQTDWIDLFQLHVGMLDPRSAEVIADTLDRLHEGGVIRHYGWSTDDPGCARLFGKRPHAAAIQFDLNIFQDAPAMLDACREHRMTPIIRQPLAMGFLTGRFSGASKLPQDDIRCHPPEWLTYFEEGGKGAAFWMRRLEQLRDVLTSDGRSLVQGALGWIWAREGSAIPIPGIRTVAQAEENFEARRFGPLNPAQMAEIERILERDAKPCT